MIDTRFQIKSFAKNHLLPTETVMYWVSCFLGHADGLREDTWSWIFRKGVAIHTTGRVVFFREGLTRLDLISIRNDKITSVVCSRFTIRTFIRIYGINNVSQLQFFPTELNGKILRSFQSLY
uniref:PH domain-containing protein n=1 Tax=Candidatus Kentrum eta TaxID=2126337 RepID=A0A450UC80_9GAMM|nr:MAG: hypothetical protein BECKH772A_GA0070896_100125 [Candidatus Kentron sp. H]VFJ89803.1 MAG: hypothetical protein BECKH772B_GA0070898_1000653 [Candidatus Kentron sp. H]VFJ97138.1 MAG: hypothetical protein BECKH772C_GA0070978_100115 [Candidatus Kentron sp. H]